MKTTTIPESLQRAGGDAFFDTMGFVPLRRRLRRVDLEAALNVQNRWKRSGFFPKPATDVPGRYAARLRKSYRRLAKRTNPNP